MKASNNTIPVWDPLVRLGHWTVVLAFFTAYFTEDDLLTQHVWAGYVVGIVVCIRVIWGFAGTRHARFGDFVRSPATALQYVGDIMKNRAKRHIGHNPAGGAMIVALLIGLTGTVYTGLVLYAIEERAGPLATWVAHEPAQPATLPPMAAIDLGDNEHERAKNTDRADDPREEFWEELHEIFTNVMLLLIGLHVVGVLWGSYAHKENLIKAMFTGRKRPNDA